MNILKDLLSSSIVLGIIFFFINIYLYKISFLKKKDNKALSLNELKRVAFFKKERKKIRLSLIFLIIFFILIVPVNLGWIDKNYSFFGYYHFLYSAILTFIIVKTSLKLIVDMFFYRYVEGSKIYYDIFKGIIFFIAIILLLKENGVSINSLFTTSAILTAIIGLALQNTLSDIVAGLILNSEDTIQKGDWIEYDNRVGVVKDFSWRYTKILTLENEFLIIPNKNLTSNDLKMYESDNIKNFFYLNFGVSYDNMPNKVIEVVSKVINNIDEILEYKIFFKGYGDSSIDFEIAFKVKIITNIRRVKSDMLTVIFYALKRNNIEIPYPKRDVYIKKTQVESLEHKHKEIGEFLKTIGILTPLTDSELDVIIKNIKIFEFAKGEYILKQNQVSAQLFYIYKGEVDVIVNGNNIATLKEKMFFGEISLMTGEKTTADIKAKTDTTLYIIDAKTFHEIFRNNEKLIDSISSILMKRKEMLDSNLKNKSFKEKKIEEEKLTNKIRHFFTL